MIKTVVREHHWSPEAISALYLDEQDHHGLIYWYNDVSSVIKEMKTKK